MPMLQAPKASPVINAHKTALMAYSVPPNTSANCLIQISSYTKLAAPEINRQKNGKNLEEIGEEGFISRSWHENKKGTITLNSSPHRVATYTKEW